MCSNLSVDKSSCSQYSKCRYGRGHHQSGRRGVGGGGEGIGKYGEVGVGGG